MKKRKTYSKPTISVITLQQQIYPLLGSPGVNATLPNYGNATPETWGESE